MHVGHIIWVVLATEMDKAMIRANVYEDEEQSIAHFMSGLHRNIQRIVEF